MFPSKSRGVPIMREDMMDFSTMPSMGMPQQKYTNYRKGVLINVYQLLSNYGNLGDKDNFIKECLGDNDINSLLNNEMVDKLDNLSGIPKLILTIYSKFISHKYLI